MLSGLTMQSSKLFSIHAILAVLFSLESARCGVTIRPGADVLLYTADFIYFGCDGVTDRNDSFVSALHIYKYQGPVAAFNDTPANLTSQSRTLFASTSKAFSKFMAEPFSNGKWTASYNQSSASSLSLYVNASGLQPQDSGIYYCEFHVNMVGSAGGVLVSTPMSVHVVDRTPDLTVNLTVSAPLLNISTGDELVMNGTSLYNITLACSASASPLAPDVQLWVSGTNVLPNSTRSTNSTMTGNVVGFQLLKTSVVVSYTVSLNDVKGCTIVRCSGYIPQYKGLAELASRQVVIKKSPQDVCSAQGNEKLAISSDGGAQLKGAGGMSTLMLLVTGLISKLKH